MRALAIASILLLAGCTSLSDKEHTFFGASATSPAAQTMPGISDLDTITKEDKADEKWWNGFYGNKSE